MTSYVEHRRLDVEMRTDTAAPTQPAWRPANDRKTRAVL